MMFIKTQDGNRLIGLKNAREIRAYRDSGGMFVLAVDTSEKDYTQDYTLGKYKTSEDAGYALGLIAKQLGVVETPESDTCRTDAYLLEELVSPEMAKAISSAYGVKTLGELADKTVYSSKGWDDFPKLTREAAKAADELIAKMGYEAKEVVKECWENPENISYWDEREAADKAKK